MKVTICVTLMVTLRLSVFCFDGYPIYGPYGYDNPTDNTSAVKIMVTGYKIRDQIAVNRPAYDSTYPKGAFIQDYEYNADLTGRHLDAYNGRFCHTPEYPTGTFAYFMSIHDDLSDDRTFVVTVSAEVMATNTDLMAFYILT